MKRRITYLLFFTLLVSISHLTNASENQIDEVDAQTVSVKPMMEQASKNESQTSSNNVKESESEDIADVIVDDDNMIEEEQPIQSIISPEVKEITELEVEKDRSTGTSEIITEGQEEKEFAKCIKAMTTGDFVVYNPDDIKFQIVPPVMFEECYKDLELQINDLVEKIIDASNYADNKIINEINNFGLVIKEQHKLVASQLNIMKGRMATIEETHELYDKNLTLARWVIVIVSMGSILLMLIIYLIWRGVVNVNKNEMEVVFAHEDMKSQFSDMMDNIKYLKNRIRKLEEINGIHAEEEKVGENEEEADTGANDISTEENSYQQQEPQQASDDDMMREESIYSTSPEEEEKEKPVRESEKASNENEDIEA